MTAGGWRRSWRRGEEEEEEDKMYTKKRWREIVFVCVHLRHEMKARMKQNHKIVFLISTQKVKLKEHINK